MASDEPGGRMIRYQAYSAEPLTDEQVKAMFKGKYGHEPTKIIRTAGAILAGPVEERKEKEHESGEVVNRV